jgi:hypothetical protein
MRPDDTERRVREWLAEAPERAPDDLIESVLAEVPATKRRSPWQPYLPWNLPGARLAGLTAAALVVALLVSLAWSGRLAGPGSAGPRPGQVQPIDVTPFGHAAITDVIDGPSGLLATGTLVENGHDQVAVWSSTDGLGWTRDADASLPRDTTAGRLAQDGTTTVMVALTCPPGPTYCGDTIVLADVAGRGWQVASGTGDGPTTIISGGPGFVAAGSNQDLSGPTGVVMTSTDGTSWTVDSSYPVFAGASIGGLAGGTGHGFVAVGQLQGAPVVWTSTDALAWTRAAPADSMSGGQLSDVALAGSRWVAVGNGPAGGLAWSSADGTAWQAAAADSGLDAANLSRVVALGSEVVALGTSTGGDGAAWVSSDGATWARLPTGSVFASAQITAVSEIDGRYLLLGQTATGSPVGALVAP